MEINLSDLCFRVLFDSSARFHSMFQGLLATASDGNHHATGNAREGLR